MVQASLALAHCLRMMAERVAKLRRLERFRRRLPHISASALASVLDDVDEHGVPEAHSRRHMREARDLAAEEHTPYGPLYHTVELDAIGGGRKTMRIVHPFALLWFAYATCATFAMLIDARLLEHPATVDQPWSLVMYSDEVTPGDALAHDQTRKIQVVYFSFLELGSNVLSREESWFTVTAKRSSEVTKISGGMSQVFGAILTVFFATAGTNMAVSGLTLKHRDNPMVRIFAKLKCFVQDGGAHKITWHCKGDGGLRLCMLCKNLFTHKSELCDDDGSGLLRCNVIVDSELDMATDAEIINTVRDLAAHADVDSKGDFEARQKIVGFVHEPSSMLLNPDLDGVIQPASQFMHDWMHGIFGNGVFNILIYLVLEAFQDNGVANIWDHVGGYLRNYKWPGRVHYASLADRFSAKCRRSSRKAKHLKCQASDGLSMLPVLAFFFGAVALQWGVCDGACLAVVALADIVDFIVAVPRGNVTPEQIRCAVHKFLNLFTAAFGVTFLTPKFHWLLHFANHLHTFGTLLSCFVHERKHRMVKRYANEVYNTVAFEQSVLNEVLCHHLARLEAQDTFDFNLGLVHPRDAPRALIQFLGTILDIPAGQPVLVSTECRFSPLATCKRGDVVFVREGAGFVAGQVWVHTSVLGVHVSLISLWSLVRMDLDHSAAEWRLDDHAHLVEPADILDTAIWTQLDGGIVRTLLPCHLR